jgi:thiamine-monophosphate kinase
MKTIKSIGEFGIIDIVKKYIPNKKSKNILVGNGDDAFCFQTEKERTVITKDLLIEDVHFKKSWISPFDLAHKAVEINISDLAAMGNVEPKFIFVGLGISPQAPISFVKDFSKGLKSVCEKYRISLGGGDTVKAEKIVISITVIGFLMGDPIKRSGAKTGDLIGITNCFGDSGAGISLLQKYGAKKAFNKDESRLILRHNHPCARLKEAAIISKYASAMTDASDGLYFSISLLSKASNKGALVDLEKIPMSLEMKNVVKDEKKRKRFALFGGEDFELVFTVSAQKAKSLKKELEAISFIGEVNNSKEIVFMNEGRKEKINFEGFRHF